MSLDDWMKKKSLKTIDLIKIDAEGAEIEILQGAAATMDRFHPRLLVQAYHLRDGARTFERCAELLKPFGYRVEECSSNGGLLHAFYSEQPR